MSTVELVLISPTVAWAYCPLLVHGTWRLGKWLREAQISTRVRDQLLPILGALESGAADGPRQEVFNKKCKVGDGSLSAIKQGLTACASWPPTESRPRNRAASWRNRSTGRQANMIPAMTSSIFKFKGSKLSATFSLLRMVERRQRRSTARVFRVSRLRSWLTSSRGLGPIF
jgi:hypothetical protein